METPHNYIVNLQWKELRKGTISSPVLTNSIEVATPPEFPGGIPNIWSPEHLFTAAVNSCYMTTFLAIAENSKLEFSEFSCTAKGKLDKIEGKFMITEVALEPILVISDETQKERAERILVKAEAACLISNSVRSSVSLKPVINIAAKV